MSPQLLPNDSKRSGSFPPLPDLLGNPIYVAAHIEAPEHLPLVACLLDVPERIAIQPTWVT